MPVDTARFLTFEVFGTPVPQGSKRVVTSRSGKTLLIDQSGEKLRSWRSEVMASALERAKMLGTQLPMPAPLCLRISFYFTKPKSSRNHMPVVRPDLDKLVRAVLDSLTQAGVIEDDAQVVELHAEKRYHTYAVTTVSVQSVGGVSNRRRTKTEN
jgi:Holliday junction resolvase RusA-like endonuclease